MLIAAKGDVRRLDLYGMKRLRNIGVRRKWKRCSRSRRSGKCV